MNGPTIYYNIAEMCGTDLSSTKLASELRNDILEQISLGFNIELDFTNVRSISNGWGRNLIGIIVKNHGEDFFKKHIIISNMSENVRMSMLEGIEQILV